jgi:hypothetical protein
MTSLCSGDREGQVRSVALAFYALRSTRFLLVVLVAFAGCRQLKHSKDVT